LTRLIERLQQAVPQHKEDLALFERAVQAIPVVQEKALR